MVGVSVVIDAEVPVKIMVGSASVPFVCEGRERSSQKMGFSLKCATVLNLRRNTYQSHLLEENLPPYSQ